MISSNLFHRRCPHHSRFFVPNLVAIFRGDPLTVVSNAGGVWKKIAIFRPTSLYLAHLLQDRARFTMESQQELVCDLSNDAFSSDHE